MQKESIQRVEMNRERNVSVCVVLNVYFVPICAVSCSRAVSQIAKTWVLL